MRKPRVLSLAAALLLTSACATRAHEMTKNLLEGNDSALRGDYSAAVTHYESALSLVPDEPAAKRNLGIVLVKVGNYKRAKKLLSEVAEHYARDVEVQYFLGEANRGAEDFKSAAFHYQRAMRIQPSDLRVVKALAWTWYKLAQYDRALAAAQPLLKANPADLQVRLIVGSTFNKLRRHQDAIAILGVAERPGFKIQSRDKVTAESERALLLTALAEAYAGQDNCRKAASLFGDVLRTRPFLSSALTGSARCDLRANHRERALTKLERATKVDPDTSEAHFLLGRIFENTDRNKAIFYYRRFLLLAHDNPEFQAEARETRNALNTLERRGTSGR